jgi:hypothetical protein
MESEITQNIVGGRARVVNGAAQEIFDKNTL